MNFLWASYIAPEGLPSSFAAMKPCALYHSQSFLFSGPPSASSIRPQDTIAVGCRGALETRHGDLSPARGSSGVFLLAASVGGLFRLPPRRAGLANPFHTFPFIVLALDARRRETEAVSTRNT
jgi:hypothetical protein